MSSPISTLTKERALTLLGQGIPPSAVANALGVEPSYISQLMSVPEFSESVAEKKYVALSKHNERDGVIDQIEDSLLGKLKDSVTYMTRPMEILKSFQIINAAKRKGQTTPEHMITKQDVIPLTIPNVVLNKVTVNVHNQVIKIGDKSLLTMPSNALLALTEAGAQMKQISQIGQIENVEVKNVSPGT